MDGLRAHQEVDRGVWLAVSTSTKPRAWAVPNVVGGKLRWMCWFSALLFHCVSTNSCECTHGLVSSSRLHGILSSAADAVSVLLVGVTARWGWKQTLLMPLLMQLLMGTSMSRRLEPAHVLASRCGRRWVPNLDA